MTNKLLSLLKLKDFIWFGVIIICLPFIYYSDINFIYILLGNHYVTLVINNYILLLLYKKMNLINTIKLSLITRIGYKKTREIVYSYINIIALIFIFILYIFFSLVYGIEGMNIYMLGLLLLNTFILLILCNIICLQFNHESNILYIVIPITVNLIVHYFIFVGG